MEPEMMIILLAMMMVLMLMYLDGWIEWQ